MKTTKPQPAAPVQIRVGTYPLGSENVDLYALPDSFDGFFYCRPDDVSPGRIKIGLKSDHWDEIVSVLLHETFEMLCAKQRHRYEKSGVHGDHASYTFIFNHSDFTELCQSQATFIARALPDLSKCFTQQRKSRHAAH